MRPLKHSNSIEKAVSMCRRDKRAALMVFVPIGYPSLAQTSNIISSMDAAGADLFELGIPVRNDVSNQTRSLIRHANSVALEGGITVNECFESVIKLRAAKILKPIILAVDQTTLTDYGTKGFVEKASEASVNGILVSDLNLAESDNFQYQCRTKGLEPLFPIGPKSTDLELTKVSRGKTGLIYVYDPKAKTPKGNSVPRSLELLIKRLRISTNLPIAIGFRIHAPEQARSAASIADVVGIGSSIVNLISKHSDPIPVLMRLTSEMLLAMNSTTRSALGKS